MQSIMPLFHGYLSILLWIDMMDWSNTAMTQLNICRTFDLKHVKAASAMHHTNSNGFFFFFFFCENCNDLALHIRL